MTRLDFAGEWGLVASVVTACALALAGFVLYRRILGGRCTGWARLLPFLRALSIALVVMMLGGPVLKHRQVRGTLTRLNVIVDGSQSMQLTDPDMAPARRARIAARLGWIPEGAVPPHLVRAEEGVLRLQEAVRQVVDRSRSGVFEEGALKRAAELEDGLRKEIETMGMGRDLVGRYDREIHEPLKKWGAASNEAARKSLAPVIDRVAGVGKGILAEVEEVVRNAVSKALEGNPAAREAVERVGSTPRWQRLQMMLATGADKGMLGRLRAGFDLRVRKLDGMGEVLVPDETVAADAELSFLGEASGLRTDLGAPLGRDLDAVRASGLEEGERSVTVLISDGQHHVGESPVVLARRLGDRKSPVFAVGVGGVERSPDLAVQGLDAPMRVSAKDRIRGSVQVREDVKAGLEYRVRIRHGADVVWEEVVNAGDAGSRKVPFEIPVEPLLGREGGRSVSQGLLLFETEVVPFTGEREVRNNRTKFTVQAIERKRTILILDSGPRWDMRYLRNLFERDSQWEVNALLKSAEGDGSKSPWERGDRAGTYPQNGEAIAKYDLVVLGDVPASWLSAEEAGQLAEHVSKGGAGLVLVEGVLGHLKGWLAGPLGAAFPVEYAGERAFQGAESWVIRKAGRETPVLTLGGDSGGGLDVWNKLQVARRITLVREAGGAEVLMAAKGPTGEAPFLVTRRFGAGRVVHLAADETWRWRYEVGGVHHDRFWNQLVGWVAEPPFVANGKHVSLDSDRPVYRPGETAYFRVKLTDDAGRPVLETRAKASVFRDGIRLSQLPLLAESGRPGVYRAGMVMDSEGSFEVGVEGVGGDSAMVRARFEVEGFGAGELGSLRMNEALMREISGASGGTFLFEEELGRIEELVRPFTEGEVLETETVLWTSYWWLSAIVGLLGAEWILRKRLGMI
ncbi:MAG: hypothetical protein RIS92_219 [Verrucomicrobiota bacterium]|jgi:hypothetical protein